MLIHNATVITFDDENRILADGAVYIDGDTIYAVGTSAELIAAHPDAERWDAHGLLLMPGQICAHTHFYGTFARGMNIPGPPPKDFPAILEKVWWRLDKALDLDGVHSSAEVCLADAIRHGTTTLIDHHASQHAIDGSLDAIADAVAASGLRAVLCYEVSDRDGPEAAQAGIRENVRFQRAVTARRIEDIENRKEDIENRKEDIENRKQRVDVRRWRLRRPLRELSSVVGRIAATFGLHASLTLSDATLEACRAESDRFHIHVAEHPVDQTDSLAKSGQRVVERLHRFDITGPDSIMAHCVHIDAWEMALLRETETWVTHQPRSNMNNAVGAAAITQMLRGGMQVGLGNDGFSNDMFAEMKVADLWQKAAHGDPRYLGADQVVRMAVHHNRQLVARFFEKPVGVIAPGAYADLVLLDYYPTTPLTAANLPWHILFGISGSHVHSTLCHGQVLMRNRELLTLDEAALAARSRTVAQQTWARYQAQF